ncbi:DUF3987 domain-containing protein [Nitrospiraceae bacterium AH_259_D15_M11_P09]|nr:DUF3987 domain-containing protein [Nitrospiraceae bacterium AH_259_D15_M11_P09]
MHPAVQRLEALAHAPLNTTGAQDSMTSSPDNQDQSGRSGHHSKAASAHKPKTDWPSLDPAALYGLPGRIVKAIAPVTEADPVALLIHLLAEFSCIIGWGAHIVLEGAFSLLLFWTVLVGDTSKSRKGTANKRIQRVFGDAIESWTRGAYRGNLSSGEGLVYAVRDPVYKPQAKYEKGKPTGETEEVLVDEGVSDKRLFLVQTEFGSMLKVMGREGNSLSGVIRDAWDGEDLAPMTKGNPIRATNPIIGIVGHVTKEELLRHLNDTEASNGFGNRFAWFAVRRAEHPLPFGGSPDQSTMAPLIEALREAVEFAWTAGKIGLTDEAASEWKAIYPELSEGKPGMVGALLGREEAQVRRLVALYALLDKKAVAEEVHLEAALALWQYAEDSTRWIFGDATGDQVADTILRAVRASGQLTDTEISHLFSGNTSVARLDRAKQSLAVQGLMYAKMEDTGGRSRRVWKPGQKPTP